MHKYACDSGGRKNVPLFLAAASIGLTWLLNYLFSFWNLILPWWVEGPSVLGFYGLLYTVFDEKLWKTSLIRKVLKIPVLSGTWNGYISSSYDNFQTKLDAEMQIRQTWTSMSILMKTEHSKGQSITAMLANKDLEEPRLTYEYLNEPNSDSPISMQIHKGTTLLTVAKNAQTMEGEYYSGRGRSNYGILHFERT